MKSALAHLDRLGAPDVAVIDIVLDTEDAGGLRVLERCARARRARRSSSYLSRVYEKHGVSGRGELVHLLFPI